MKISTVGANVKFEFPSCGWSLVVEPTCGAHRMWMGNEKGDSVLLEWVEGDVWQAVESPGPNPDEPTLGSMTCHGCAHLMAVLKYLNRLEVESRYNESFAPVDLVRDNVHNAMQS
jgi:hypothetical protein